MIRAPSQHLNSVNVSCCVCGDTRGERYAQGPDFEYGTTHEEFPFQRCVSCGHVYLNPRPALDELDTIYPPDYYAYDMARSIHPWAMQVKNALERRKIKRLLRRCPRDLPRCLDIGCGNGRLLDTIAGTGVPGENLWGIELNESVVDRLVDKGYHAHCGRIEDLDLPTESFDFVIMFQVLEHVEDPARIFKTVSRLLAPGGIFVVETPNIRSLDARMFRHRYWGGYHFPRHWNLFHEASLKRLGERSGLTATKFETFICAVFWIYPIHHWLREKGAPRPIYRFFWPTSNPLLLAGATVLDMTLSPFGLTSNLRACFQKRPSGTS